MAKINSASVARYYDAFTGHMNAISAYDRSMGLVWYPITAKPIIAEGVASGLTVYQSVCAFAALSANVRLEGNWNLYHQFCATRNAGAIPCAIDGAKRVITTDGPACIAAMTVPNSKAFKTKAFAMSILASIGLDIPVNVIDPLVACLDRWINRAGTGDMTLTGPPSDYADMALAMSQVAYDMGLPIYVVQAMIWCHIQTIAGVNWIRTDPNVLAYRMPPMLHGGY